MLDGTRQLWLCRIVLVAVLAVNSRLSRSLWEELLRRAEIWLEEESCLQGKVHQRSFLPIELPFPLQLAQTQEPIHRH